ncbi:hypothetical protein XELAEV_18027452mg [Xenopus laevis]|uniref:Uncharacterized protein n=1 Tax=Xenopus laevis TaxID=8355 RepID=A0A974CVH1_XENLA|nr:hypothetical protein XELAEV_18027452mg [Xenopus laevis]
MVLFEITVMHSNLVHLLFSPVGEQLIQHRQQGQILSSYTPLCLPARFGLNYQRATDQPVRPEMYVSASVNHCRRSQEYAQWQWRCIF